MADLFKKYKSLFTTTANTFSTGSDVDITLNSATGLPTDTDITLTFDRVDSAGAATSGLIERITGRVSGVSFTVVERGVDGTTEQSHTSPVVEQVWNSNDWNDLIDGLLAQHSQAGAHTAITGTSVSVIGNASASNVSACNIDTSVLNIGGGVDITKTIDDDTMATATASTVSTSESIKAYVDAGVTTDTSDTTPTPTGNKKRNEYYMTALAGAAEFQAPSGTPANGNMIMMRIKDDGTARALTWNAVYASRTATLPTTTVLGKYQYNIFIYNSTTSTWDCVLTQDEA